MDLTLQAPGHAVQTFQDQGFLLIRQAIPDEALKPVESDMLALLEQISGQKLQSMTSPEFAKVVSSSRELEQSLYNGIRKLPGLTRLASHPSVTRRVADLLGDDIGVLGKTPLRIDLPMVTRELAVWHQDHFYVRGNTDTVTAWIPFQATPFEIGCLMVMPGSHKLGVVPHDKPLLGKKFVPSGIFDRPVRYVEMERGDLLLFHSLLLHSSGMNISDTTRFSINARYSRMSQPVDPAMGTLTPVGETLR